MMMFKVEWHEGYPVTQPQTVMFDEFVNNPDVWNLDAYGVSLDDLETLDIGKHVDCIGVCERTTITKLTDNGVKYIVEGMEQPSLEDAQSFVGGWVERVVFDNGDIGLCNEEGMLKGLPVNPEITKKYGVMLCGPVIVIHKEARKPNSEEGWG